MLPELAIRQGRRTRKTVSGEAMKKLFVATAVTFVAAQATATGVLFVAKDPSGARIELRDEICPFAEHQAQYMTWHKASMSDGDSIVSGCWVTQDEKIALQWATPTDKWPPVQYLDPTPDIIKPTAYGRLIFGKKQ
ncbi:hypothetical protein BZM27_37485 [Paraburkholderia steynii]|uniref:Uncharacterized protein n=1 Tax=Paraburkholderia steynii TaxID=1245441 RepID=A0A4R0XFS3_9BURK|nr:hypothetical protein BZM27_37485 [Paraburkholderia steynii]